jgi:hypothetical protein
MKLHMFAVAVALLPAACQAPANPPSLLPRAIEKQSMDNPAPSPPQITPKPADAALVAQLGRLLADARAGDADFTALERSNAANLAAGQRLKLHDKKAPPPWPMLIHWPLHAANRRHATPRWQA